MVLALGALLLLTGCLFRRQDERLERISGMIPESPEEALSLLDSIDYGSLSEADRHFYDLIMTKAEDRAYIEHTSDSLILDAIDYYGDSGQDKLYSEALYYGGRVYSDMGDFPTALKYFHLALDQLKSPDADPEFKNRVLSQTGRLLGTLRLYDEATPYIESALEVNRQVKDTTSLVYNMQLLGATYLRAGEYTKAENNLEGSLKTWNPRIDASIVSISKMYLAEVKSKQGKIDSALSLIRGIPERIDPVSRNSALEYAADIYRKAGLPDTAYIYSLELLSSPDTQYHEIGYQTILSPELREYVNPDSIYEYIADYVDLLETLYDTNQSQSVISRQNQYNYRLHERKREEAESMNEFLWRVIGGVIVAFICMGYVIMIVKNRDKRHVIELQQAREYIDTLVARQTAADVGDADSSERTKDSEISTNMPITGTTAELKQKLREKLRDGLMTLYERSKEKPEVPDMILQSEPYQKVLDRLKACKLIKDDDILWDEIEEVVLKCSPKFKENLLLLTLGKMTTAELRTALLIKIGIKPSEMIILLGKSNGAIISRRESLCLKVLDKKMGVKVIDGIIRLL